ncbi:MAG: putative toxin-antitoxin system toxin component, PIN family [Desulfobacteraceae bacterium]|nr:MAG: putative toxin-antitoxin system toxin component, PIN family [Desulfobacteraceae bacterium]
MKIVLDTNQLISAILSPDGNPAIILDEVLAGTLTLVISSKILQEAENVLSYPKLVELLKKKGVSPEKIKALLDKLRIIGVMTHDILHPDIIRTDPSDNMILACAIEGEADFIISGDHHLTDLKTYQSIRIIDPATFITQLAEARKG